jgi:hypothetical protein
VSIPEISPVLRAIVMCCLLGWSGSGMSGCE